MLEKIKKHLVESLYVDEDQITLETDLSKDLGADSLDLIQLTMALEDQYDIKIPDEMLKQITTVGDVINCLKEMGIEE